MTATPTPRVVFLDRATLSPETHLRTLSFAHQLDAHATTTPEQVADRIADADIVIVNKVRLDAAALAAASRLRLVAVAATGTDNVDLAACAQRGIIVSNVRNYAVHTVPEHVFALVFALRRSLLAYRDSVRAGRWQQSGQFCYFDYPIRDLAGSTLGVIGGGVLGRGVAAMGRALGMSVLLAGRKGAEAGPQRTPFVEVLRQSDVISLHVPLTAQTRHVIDAPEFAEMRRQPLLINTARGGLVNKHALAAALAKGQVAGAGFDVTTPEPPPADSPLMQLVNLPNFILTPHVAWASREAVQALADQLVDNIEAFWRGQPVNVVAAPR